MLVRSQYFQSLLHNSATELVHRIREDKSLNLEKECLALWQVAVVEHLLDHIVAENVLDQFFEIWNSFSEQNVLLDIVCFFESLLDEARALLI